MVRVISSAPQTFHIYSDLFCHCLFNNHFLLNMLQKISQKVVFFSCFLYIFLKETEIGTCLHSFQHLLSLFGFWFVWGFFFLSFSFVSSSLQRGTHCWLALSETGCGSHGNKPTKQSKPSYSTFDQSLIFVLKYVFLKGTVFE